MVSCKLVKQSRLSHCLQFSEKLPSRVYASAAKQASTSLFTPWTCTAEPHEQINTETLSAVLIGTDRTRYSRSGQGPAGTDCVVKQLRSSLSPQAAGKHVAKPSHASHECMCCRAVPAFCCPRWPSST
ncbi:unnamed protein product [Protopolystoma xenopodis]|uniref:Uncharacterized protein n=1 Tax=Protopolystoma xenopodis TaxID=117903 RepID=A0A3S5CIB7_9PLAT|nr:unnamed protein product [Protopolystoma xenopodis]